VFSRRCCLGTSRSTIDRTSRVVEELGAPTLGPGQEGVAHAFSVCTRARGPRDGRSSPPAPLVVGEGDHRLPLVAAVDEAGAAGAREDPCLARPGRATMRAGPSRARRRRAGPGGEGGGRLDGGGHRSSRPSSRSPGGRPRSAGDRRQWGPRGRRRSRGRAVGQDERRPAPPHRPRPPRGGRLAAHHQTGGPGAWAVVAVRPDQEVQAGRPTARSRAPGARAPRGGPPASGTPPGRPRARSPGVGGCSRPRGGGPPPDRVSASAASCDHDPVDPDQPSGAAPPAPTRTARPSSQAPVRSPG